MATAPALPFLKSVFKSQNRKCVRKSQQVCPYVCVSHKIEKGFVSHKILIHQVLPRGLHRGGLQWYVMVLNWWLADYMLRNDLKTHKLTS